MATEAQIKANRLNTRKSTGPKTADGKAAVSQNALKHGLFAAKNVIKCENQHDFNQFRAELLADLAPVSGVEAMMAERIVSLSWRLKRAERMTSEAIDVKIAWTQTSKWQKKERKEAGLLDPKTGRSELMLGWVTIRDFANSKILEQLLMYEKRIESSLYKAMNELQKLQRVRKLEEAEAAKAEAAVPIPISGGLDEITTHRGRDAHETQGLDALATEAATHSEGERLHCEEQSQCPTSPPNTLRSDRTKIASLSGSSAAAANSAVIAKQSQCRPAPGQ